MKKRAKILCFILIIISILVFVGEFIFLFDGLAVLVVLGICTFLIVANTIILCVNSKRFRSAFAKFIEFIMYLP